MMRTTTFVAVSSSMKASPNRLRLRLNPMRPIASFVYFISKSRDYLFDSFITYYECKLVLYVY